jgi:hypothetical protein
MGIPLSASLSNALPTTKPQGLHLASDINASFISDNSWFDSDPLRNNETPPATPLTYLGRLAAYNNVMSDRGAISPGRNGFPSRATSTEEVRMGDFFNVTNTVATASAYSSMPGVYQLGSSFLTSSRGYYEFVESSFPFAIDVGGNPPNYKVYPWAYVDSNEDPRLSVIWVSGSNNFSPPYTTGSNYSFVPFTNQINSIAIDTSVYSLTVDDGTLGSNYNPLTDYYTAKVGIFYYTQGNVPNGTTFGVPYEVTMSTSTNTPVLFVNTGSKYIIENSFTFFGSIIRDCTSYPQSIPPIIGGGGGGEDMVHSSVALYTGYPNTGLYAKLTTLSGSRYRGDSTTVSYTGARYQLHNSTTIDNPAYVASVVGPASGIVTVYGRVASGDTDQTCSISSFSPEYYNQGVIDAIFKSNPSAYLNLTASTYNIINQTLITQSLAIGSAGGFGSKAICNIPVTDTNLSVNSLLMATTRANDTLEVYVLYLTGSSPTNVSFAIGASVTGIGFEVPGIGYIDHTQKISLSFLGSYDNYSASLATNNTTYGSSIDCYYMLNYVRTDGFGGNTIIKVNPKQYITVSSGTNIKNTTQLNTGNAPANSTVGNGTINYKDFGGFNNIINIGPKENMIPSYGSFAATPVYTSGSGQRVMYFTKPIISWYNQAGANFTIRNISLY